MDIGVDEIRQMHLQRGFKDIGYNRVIRRNGEWEQGREDDEVGANVEGYNSVSIGICLVGGLNKKMQPEDNFTKEQMDTLMAFVLELREMYPGAIIQGHRDFPNVAKACPSFNVTQWMADNEL
jgi:N-acetylmuramoyl-L-alanine amidase